MRLSLPALALIAAAVPLAAQTTTSAGGDHAAPAPAAAPRAMSTYRNDTLHLAYSYPASYTDASATVGPAFEASIGNENLVGKDVTRCLTLPFSVMNSSGGQFGVVLLLRADAGCMKKTFTAAQLPELTRGEVQSLTASGAHTQFDEPVAFTTLGHPAELLHGTFELPTGNAMHALVVCLLVTPDVACWQFLASSEQSLRTMSAFPVALQGGAAAPLVSAAVLPKP